MKLAAFTLFALAAAGVSPAYAAANKEHLQLLAEIRMLQEQNAQLQQLLGALQDTLKTVGTKIDDQTAASRKAMADQALAINNIGDTVRVLRERTDDTNVRIGTVSSEIEALRQAIVSSQAAAAAAAAGTMPATGVAGTTDPTAPPAGAAPTTPTAPPPTTPSTVSPSRMYEASYDDYMAGRWQLAIQGFEGFIQAFPRMPNAADAQYNIGMSYYNMGRWGDARDAFQKVINNYPQAQGTVVPDSYYKLGQTYERLSQVDNAKKAYEFVIQKYPTTTTATLAKQLLDRLNRR